MRNRRNKNAPPVGGLVEHFIGSEYDTVKLVSDNIDLVIAVGEAIEDGTLDYFLEETDINTLAKLNTIVADATLLDEATLGTAAYQAVEAFATAAEGILAANSMQLPIATQGEAEAGLDNERPMTPLRVQQAIATFAPQLQNDYDAAVDPTPDDDSDDGWSAGSIWINTTADPNESFRCSDPTVGTAVWLKTTLTSDELATVALTGDSDDLTEGSTKLLMTATERSRLAGMEDNATADQTGAEIKGLYEAESDTNAFTDAEKTSLATMEDNAAADQTDAEITNAYNNEVDVVSQVDAEAGTDPAVKRWTPERVGQAIAALAAGGDVEEAPEDGTPYSRQDAGWVAAGSGGGVPSGGAAGQIIVKQSAVEGDADWEDTSAGQTKTRTVRTLIETITNATADEFDFNNIPSGYDRLIIKAQVLSDVGADSDDLYAFINEELTASDYHYQHVVGYNGVVYPVEGATPRSAIVGGSTTTADSMGYACIEIEAPDSSYLKLITGQYGYYRTTDAIYCGFASMSTPVTAAITRIRLRTDNHPTDQLTGIVHLYGEKDEEIGGGGAGMTALYKDAGYTLTADDLVYSEAGLTHVLPLTPNDGDKCSVWDVSDNAGSNAITVDRNGETIMGVADDFSLNMNGGRVDFAFDAGEDTWLYSYVVQTIQPSSVVTRIVSERILVNAMHPNGTQALSTATLGNYEVERIAHSDTYTPISSIIMTYPDNISSTEISFRYFWYMDAAATDDVLMSVRGDNLEDGDDLDANYSTTQLYVTSSNNGAKLLNISPWSPWNTLAGGAGVDKFGKLTIRREGPNGNDTSTDTMYLLAIEIRYRTEETLTAAVTNNPNTVSRDMTGTTDTLLASDAGKVIYASNAASQDLGIPDGLPVGFQFVLAWEGVGEPSVSMDGSETKVGESAPPAQYGKLHMEKRDATTWWGT